MASYSVKQVFIHILTTFYVVLVISDYSINHVHLLLTPQFVQKPERTALPKTQCEWNVRELSSK